MTYEEYTTNEGNLFIKRINDDGTTSFIPVDETNSDYQEYLNRDNPDWGKPLL
jgi:hypothetical protein